MHSAWSRAHARRRLVSHFRNVVLAFVALSLGVVPLEPHAFAATNAPTPSASVSPSPDASSTTGKTPPPEVTWGIGPAAAVGADERPYFSFGVTPGAEAKDQVTVVNYSTTPLNLNVYAVLANNNADTGAIGFVSETDTPVDLASWLTVGSARPVTVTVPGRLNASAPPGQVSLPVKLVVPLNAQPGDHVGGIVAALNVASTNTTGEHVNLEQRVVTRVYVRVSGLLKPKLEITNLHTSYREKGYTLSAGSMVVKYTVRNVGNVRVAGTQAVHVSGLFGSSKHVVPASIVQLLPGGSAAVSVIVHGVLPTVLVRPHVTVVPTAFPGDVDPPLKKLTATAWVWAIPWAALAVVALIAGMLWLRRRRMNGPRRPAALTANAVAGGTGRHRVETPQQAKSRHAR